MATPPEGLPSWSAPSLVARGGRETPAASGRHRGTGRGSRRATARTTHRLTGVPVLPGPATAALVLVGAWRRWWAEASARRARAVAVRRAGPHRSGLRWTILCLACAGGTALGSFVLAGPVTALTGHDLEMPAAAATGQQPTWLGPAGPIPPLQVPAEESIAAFMAPTAASGTVTSSSLRGIPPLQLPDAPAPAAPVAPRAPVAPGAPPAPVATAVAPAPSAAPPAGAGPTGRPVARDLPVAPPPRPAPSTSRPVRPAPPTTTTPARTTPGTTAPGTTAPGTTAPGTTAVAVPAACRKLLGPGLAACLTEAGLPLPVGLPPLR